MQNQIDLIYSIKMSFFVIVFLDQDFFIANLFDCCLLLLWSFAYNEK